MKDEPALQERFSGLGESYFWFGAQNDIVERTLTPCLARLRTAIGNRSLRLLDFGCGPGNMLHRLERAGLAFGSDFSLRALAFCRGKGLRRLLASDSAALPFRTGALDGVIALDVLEHVEDDAGALQEIARVLRPGGLFLFVVPAFPTLWRSHDAIYGHHRRYRRCELLAKLHTAGLKVEQCRFIKCAFFLPLLALAGFERLTSGPGARVDNFWAIPGWLNSLLAAEIRWEDRFGVTRIVPFGASLLCAGRR